MQGRSLEVLQIGSKIRSESGQGSKDVQGTFGADILISRLQKEYEALMIKINEFSLARRQWIEASRTTVIESYDIEILKDKVKTLKANLLQQKKDWLILNEKLNQAIISTFDRMSTSS